MSLYKEFYIDDRIGAPETRATALTRERRLHWCFAPICVLALSLAHKNG